MTKMLENLQEELGQPAIFEKGMEEGAIDKLKSLSGKING